MAYSNYKETGVLCVCSEGIPATVTVLTERKRYNTPVSGQA